MRRGCGVIIFTSRIVTYAYNEGTNCHVGRAVEICDLLVAVLLNTLPHPSISPLGNLS